MAATIARLDFARRAGKTFGGKRDLYEVLGYQRNLDPGDYRQRYERDGVAGRIVDTYADATWRTGGAVTDDETPESDTEFERAWAALDERLQIWPTFQTVDRLAGLGEFAVLLLGVRDGSTLDAPLPDSFSPEDLIYLSAFGQQDIDVTKLVTDSQDPRFGQPLEYTLTRIGDPKTQLASSSIRRPKGTTAVVHWSRVVHVASGLLDDKIFGAPRLRNVWNRLDDLDKVAGGGAEAFWLRANQGYIASLDKDLKLDADDIQDLKDQVEEFAHQIRRTIGQRGVDFKALGSDVADFSNPVSAIFDLLAASTGIPKRILMGSERGELASSQDKTNFDDRVSDRRENFAEPVVVRPFVDRLVVHSALPTPFEDSYAVLWPDLDTLDVTERANTAVKLSVVNRNEGETVYTRDEIREVTGHAALEEAQIDIEDEESDELLGVEPVAAAGVDGGESSPTATPKARSVPTQRRVRRPSPSGELSIGRQTSRFRRWLDSLPGRS